MSTGRVSAYDIVSYPTAAFRNTSPGHLATIATLHGLSPADPARARVLEIGGGDGMNMIAHAVAYPHAQVTSFDLAAAPVARGRAVAEALGLSNVTIRVGDIFDEADRLDGPYDYVIAHGVYAWVPPPVRAALMRLVGRVLAPAGVAFISYNAKPGGQLREILRDMALHAVEGIDDPVERLEAGWQALADFARADTEGHPALAGLRREAELICKKRPEVLHHDELGSVFDPQSLSEVAAAAAANGLAFLNDSQQALLASGFAKAGEPADTPVAALVRTAQARDYRELRFFRESLFVRAEATAERRPSHAGLHRLWLSSRARRIEPFRFEIKEGKFTIQDEVLSDLIADAGGAQPIRLAIADRVAVDDGDRLDALFQLFEVGAIGLHAAPLPAVLASERPEASVLARFLADARKDITITLDHQMIPYDDPGARAFLAMLDGSRDVAALEAEWAAGEHGATIPFADALASVAGAALLSR